MTNREEVKQMLIVAKLLASAAEHLECEAFERMRLLPGVYDLGDLGLYESESDMVIQHELPTWEAPDSATEIISKISEICTLVARKSK